MRDERPRHGTSGYGTAVRAGRPSDTAPMPAVRQVRQVELPQERGRGRGGRRRNGAGRVVARVLLVALLALVVAAGAAAFALLGQARDVESLTRDASAQGQAAYQAFLAGDQDGFDRSASAFAEDVDQAYATTHGALWDACAAVPYVGSDVRCVQRMAQIAKGLSDDGLAPFARSVDEAGLSGLVSGGDLTLAGAEEIAGPARSALDAAQAAVDAVEGLPDGVTPPVRQAVAQAKSAASEAGASLASLDSELRGLEAQLSALR